MASACSLDNDLDVASYHAEGLDTNSAAFVNTAGE